MTELSHKHFEYCLVSIAVNIVPHMTGNACYKFCDVKPHFPVSHALRHRIWEKRIDSF